MKKLAEHAALLAEALSGIDEPEVELLDDVTSYLQLAAGIRQVEFSRLPFDPYAGYCETADDFNAEQDKLWGALVTRLSVFLFVWAAVEAFKDYLPLTDPPPTPGKKKRQIDKLCCYLTINYKCPLPEKYTELLTFFKKVASQADIKECTVSFTALPAYMQPVAEGLYLVYEYRNAFAHGDFKAPTPDEEIDPIKHPDVLIVTVATKIVLLTIQMLALCFYPHGLRVDMPSLLTSFRSEGTCVREAFLNLHLKSFGGRLEDKPPKTREEGA